MTALRVLTAEDCELIRVWRNQNLAAWRTSHLLTEEMQAEFYREVVCNRNAPHRFWAVDEGSRLVGMVGITHIQWENRLAEVNLIMAPDMMRLAHEAVDLLLKQAFDFMGLLTVCGECYMCSPQLAFWKQVSERHEAYTTTLPRRKWWDGKLWDSLHISFRKNEG